MCSDLIDIDCIEIHRTDAAIKVRWDDDRPDVWLPLSSVEVEPAAGNARVRYVTVRVPMQLAIDKGLV